MNPESSNNGIPDIAFAILDKLSALNTEISFNFDNMEVKMPAKPDAPEMQVKVNGTLRISTKTNKNQV